ncbi:MAG: hypothetical protein ACFCVK_04120 [Acidimicrobiales bacterium]
MAAATTIKVNNATEPVLGRGLARRKQAAVAFERMSRLVANEDVERTVMPRWAPVHGRTELLRPPDVSTGEGAVDQLHVDELGVRFADGGGVSGWCGWNGTVVMDRAAFLVPPNAAYLSQVPKLLSDSVRDNVGLGTVSTVTLARTLELTALVADVAAMPAGIDTIIGPRRLRLSGGQRQRLATARALVPSPNSSCSTTCRVHSTWRPGAVVGQPGSRWIHRARRVAPPRLRLIGRTR